MRPQGATQPQFPPGFPARPRPDCSSQGVLRLWDFRKKTETFEGPSWGPGSSQRRAEDCVHGEAGLSHWGHQAHWSQTWPSSGLLPGVGAAARSRSASPSGLAVTLRLRGCGPCGKRRGREAPGPAPCCHRRDIAGIAATARSTCGCGPGTCIKRRAAHCPRSVCWEPRQP